jgi:hypothetical protein
VINDRKRPLFDRAFVVQIWIDDMGKIFHELALVSTMDARIPGSNLPKL